MVTMVIFGVGVLRVDAPLAGATSTSSHLLANDVYAAAVGPKWADGTTLEVNPDLGQPVPLGDQTPHISQGIAADAVSSKWAGLVDAGATYTALSAYWTVPAVQPSESSAVSSTWIGLDGYSDTSMIQAGTEQDISGGSTSYFAWYEALPGSEVEIGGVSPGDEMYAEIYQDSPGLWVITIQDLTSNQSYSGEVSYNGPGTSAEWIEESTTVSPGPQPPLANFGSAQFDTLEIGTPDPSDGISTPIVLENASDDVLAYPANFVNDDMTVYYGQPSTQTSVSASPSNVTSGTSVSYSATVSSGGEGTPTGSVAFSTGSTRLCTASLSNGTGSCTSRTAPVGTETISGTYSGDNVFASSTGTANLRVNAPPPPPPPPQPQRQPQHGYWLVGSDGGIFTFGSAPFYGSTGSIQLQRAVVGIVPTEDSGGYWLDASDGGIFAFGDAGFYGSIPGFGLHPAGSGRPNSLNAPIVGMVPSADGGGYFMVASDGGVFAFGDARFAGSCPAIGGCSGAAVAVMPDASGDGYWVVTQTGGVYTFGDAPFYGAPGPQSVPVTSAVRTPDGRGYWILFANGAISNFGDASPYGSPVGLMGGPDPATAIFTTADGAGYWVAAANGAVASYGDAPDDGSMLGTRLNGSIIAATGW